MNNTPSQEPQPITKEQFQLKLAVDTIANMHMQIIQMQSTIVELQQRLEQVQPPEDEFTEGETAG